MAISTREELVAPADEAAARLFAGPGATRALGRTHDWAATPLGPAAGWPVALATLVPVVMASAFPSALLWGPDLVCVYNDAYIAFVGAYHSAAFGQPASAASAALPDALRAGVARVLAGEAVAVTDDLTAIDHHRPDAPPTTTTFSVAYTPVRDGRDPDGHVSGVHLQAVDTTNRVAVRAAEPSRGVPLRNPDGRVHAAPAVSYDVTERRAAQEAVRGAVARQAFSLKLSDALRPLSDAAEVQGKATRLLREYFEAGWSYYVEFDDTRTLITVAQDSVRDGLPSMVGQHPFDDTPEFLAPWEAGRLICVEDVHDSSLLSQRAKDRYLAAGIHAFLGVPVLKRGVLVAAFVLADTRPRSWSQLAIDLAIDSTERTWAAVERARAEAAVRASEEHNRGIVEAARDYVIFTTDVAGRIASWSPGAEAVLGWTAAEAVGQPMDMVFTPEDQTSGEPAREWAVAAEQGVAPDVRWHARKDGGRVFIEGTVRALSDAAGRLRSFLKVGQDVTERRRLDEALWASEARFRALVDNLPDYAIFGLDAAGLVTAWTPGAERVKGYAPDQIVGRPLATFYTPDDVAAGVPAHELVVAAAAGRGEWEGWRVRQDGTRFWADEIATAVHDAAGRLVGFTKISRDLTERRLGEEALRASEARFRAVANVVPDLLWQSAPEGAITWYNDRWYAFTGQTAEAADMGWTAIVHPDDRDASLAAFRAARTERRAFGVEQRMRRADGEYRWFLVQCAPLLDAAGEVAQWFGAAADIHAQRAARDEVERQVVARTAELAEANTRLAGEVAARARAQEARSALLRRLATAEDAERRHLARELHDEAGQHLTALGLGLGALGEAVPPGSELDRRVGALRELAGTLGRELHDVAVRLRPRALDDFGLESALAAYADAWAARTGIATDVHARVAAERLTPPVESAIYRIVQEALTNVARHSGATRAGVVVERRDGSVVVTVDDDGRGFDADGLQPDGAGADGGLGLLGIRERAELLGGTMDVESEPGAGTTLFVRIPMAAPNAPGEP